MAGRPGAAAGLVGLVRTAGLEPARPEGQKILSLRRLPVPPRPLPGHASAWGAWRQTIRPFVDISLASSLPLPFGACILYAMGGVRAFGIMTFVTTMIGCHPDWGGGLLSQPLPKQELIGCYRAGGAIPMLRIREGDILADDRVVYTSYEYGLGGRNSLPLLVVRPRMILQRNAGGAYAFVPWKRRTGDSFNYRVDRTPTPAIWMTASDNRAHKFIKGSCDN